MSDPVINNLGEVYQYIGDEVVVTWESTVGFRNNHCIKCFLEIKNKLKAGSEMFEKRFGLVPDCKAGIHKEIREDFWTNIALDGNYKTI